MKTTKTFRLLAVLLALVLGLGTICTALAEQSVPLDRLTNEQYAEWLKRVQAQNSFENLPVNQQYAYLMALENEEDAEAAIKSLTEEQINAIIAYAQAIEAAKPVPETVVFTKAGPFMPAVNVASTWRSVMRAGTEDSQGEGLYLSKTATAENDGIYKIRLEAYTTGEVTTTTTTVPVDIVLVLDQSGSMAYDFNGNESRQAAMKKAVNSFIEAVGGKYNANADHRMAIVTFGSGASTLQDWTYVDNNGADTLKGKISGLPNSPSGATNAGAGMQQAESLMGRGYNYTGTNIKRQKVVVFFTDGIPTTSTEFNTDVADTAINSAKNLKVAGVTVYSVGIFNGANPHEMYGASGFDTNSNGTVDSKWILDTWGLFPGTDFPEADRPAGNRFLNYLSSNSSNAISVGLSRKSDGLGIFHYKITYTITKNFDRIANNYYLTADDATSLNNIFQTISNNIQTADISLDSTTVVKDIVSPYFNVPAGANNIKVYTAACEGKDKWGKNEEVSSLKVDITNDTVSVTGFDFNANFVTEDPKKDGTRGKKLIIEFAVTAKDGFLGGNGVATNDTNSGVYYNDGRLVKAFVVPTVNVPIKDVTVTAQDKNVYLLGEVTANQLKSGATVKVGDVALDLSKDKDAEKPYGLETWQTKYVDITVEVKDKDGNVVTDKLENLTNDTTYTVEVTVSPKTDGTGAAGTPATEKPGENTPAAKINVFKPELTFKDSTVDYKSTLVTPNENGYADNLQKTEWKHGETVDSSVTMIGTVPTLTKTYAPTAGVDSNIVIATDHVPVQVTVKIGENDVTDNTTFEHQACTDAALNCQWATVTKISNGNPAFLLHVINVVGDLTITKTGLNQHTYTGENEDQESAIFEVVSVEEPSKKWTVAINGNNSVTLTGLKVGNYTVTELTDWTWRYRSSTLTSTDMNSDGTFKVNGGQTTTVICTNGNHNDKWLGGDNYENNKFGSGN